MDPITSVHNPRVKAAAALRDGRQRRKQQRTLVDGLRELRRAMESDAQLVEVYFCPQRCREEAAELLDQLRRRQVPLVPVAPRVFEKLAFGQRDEGLIGVVAVPQRSLADLPRGTALLIGVLEGVEKPGNLGAVLRSADGAGLDAMIVCDGGTDLYNPAAIRASLGTLFTMPTAAASTDEVLAWLRRRQIPVLAARVDGTLRYDQADYRRGAAIVLGSEAAGLSDAWRADDVQGVFLPMRGAADSLNVSAAAAVLFYEAARQRGFASAAPP